MVSGLVGDDTLSIDQIVGGTEAEYNVRFGRTL